jgi:hypothetical protein
MHSPRVFSLFVSTRTQKICFIVWLVFLFIILFFAHSKSSATGFWFFAISERLTSSREFLLFASRSRNQWESLKTKKNQKIFKKTRPIGDECHHGPVYNWQGRWQLDVDVNRRLHEILQIIYSDWNSWSAAQANGQKKKETSYYY